MFAYEQPSLDHRDLVFAKIDTEAEQQFAESARITCIPTLMAFRDGVLVFHQPRCATDRWPRAAHRRRGRPGHGRHPRWPANRTAPPPPEPTDRHPLSTTEKETAMGYALTTTVDKGFEDTLQAIRAALSEQGFGILTEIDLKVTLKAKIDADIDPQVILGACRPLLAHAAIQGEPSIGVLLPCNVVVRALAEYRTAVEAMDPAIMVQLTGNDALTGVADEASTRLRAALTSLGAAAV